MTYLFNFPNLTSEGVDPYIVRVTTEVSLVPVMGLLALWMFVFAGGSLIQWKRSGYSDFSMWSTLAFLSCDVVATIQTFKEGLLNPVVLSVLVGGTFLSALWFFLTKGKFEN